MRILAVFITIINIFAIFAVPTFAENELSSFDTQGLEQKINDETDLSFSDMFYDVITGNLSEVVDDIKNKIFDTFASEIKNNSDYIKTIVIVSLLCGILNTISSDLKDKSVAELVFFVGEVMVLTVAVLSLKETINIMRGYISSITGIISASIPFLSGVLVAGGKSAAFLTTGGTLVATAAALSYVADGVIIPFVIVSSLVRIVNVISQKNMLSKLSELLYEITGWIIKGGGCLYIFLLSLEKVSGSAVNNGVHNSIKSLVGAIPVVGDVAKSGMDIAANVVSVVASGSMIVIVIVLIAVSLVPVVKVVVIAYIYKFVAALCEPICDKGTVEIIDSIGDGCKLMIGCLFMVAFMFVTSVIIILGGLV